MMAIGAVLLVVAVVLIVFGIAVEAVHILLWVGIALLVLGAVLAVLSRVNRGAGGPPVV